MLTDISRSCINPFINLIQLHLQILSLRLLSQHRLFRQHTRLAQLTQHPRTKTRQSRPLRVLTQLRRPLRNQIIHLTPFPTPFMAIRDHVFRSQLFIDPLHLLRLLIHIRILHMTNNASVPSLSNRHNRTHQVKLLRVRLILYR